MRDLTSLGIAVSIAATAILGASLACARDAHGAPPSPEAIRAAAQSVLSDEDYQTTLGEYRALPGQSAGRRTEGADGGTSIPVGDGRGGGADGVRPTRPERPRQRAPAEKNGSGLATVLRALGWVLLVGMALALIAAVFRWMRQRGKPRTPKAAGAAAVAVTRPQLEQPRDEAEALASDGRYDEAIHVLLLKTLQLLARRMEGGLSRAATAREVVDRAPMPETARTALRDLVAAVEGSLFAGRPVDRATYERCAEGHRSFVNAYAGSA